MSNTFTVIIPVRESAEPSLSISLTSTPEASLSFKFGSDIRVEQISLEQFSDSTPTSFVLVVFRGNTSETRDIPFVVDKQMAQLIFRRRSIPEDVVIAAKRSALEINRNEHPHVFQVGRIVSPNRFDNGLSLGVNFKQCFNQGRMAAKMPGASTSILSPTKKRVRQISWS